MTSRRAWLRKAVIVGNLIAPVASGVLLWQGAGWWALGTIASAHACWLIPTLWPQCNWLGEVVTSLEQARAGRAERPFVPGAREVWLTIDDGPDPHDTPRLLELLDLHGARATFFFIGTKARVHPELVQEVRRRGHDVGNHTLNHVRFWFWAFGPFGVRREVAGCQQLLRQLSGGETPQWFRAPAGFKNPLVQALVERLGLRLAAWSARGRDGVLRDPEKILGLLTKGIKPGAVLLMHEGREDQHGARLAPQVLEGLLKSLRSQGYRCVLP